MTSSSKKIIFYVLFGAIYVAALSGCLSQVITSSKQSQPVVVRAIRSNFSTDKPWWQSYKNNDLNLLVSQALKKNYSLQAAWQRMIQARTLYKIRTAERFPTLNLSASSSRTHTDNKSEDGEKQSTTTNYFSLGGGLSYELDLWGRIGAKSASELALFRANKADLENTTLLLTGLVAEQWIRAQHQKAMIELIKKQIDLNQTLLELTSLRFNLGRASVLDIYQQRQQLSSSRSELPLAESQLQQTLNQLSVILGQEPVSGIPVEINGILPILPPFPEHASPASLLETRPDLRQIRELLHSRRYSIDAAIADLFPKLQIAFTYDFNASQITDLFVNSIRSLSLPVSKTLLDGGKKRAQIELSESEFAEHKATYAQTFLAAISDVENAITDEGHRKALLNELNNQLESARSSMQESRQRYLKGLSDYLQVIVSVRAVQELERRLLTEQLELLLNRNRLYLALGGAWTKNLFSDTGA